ncbi:MAG: PilT/PilU family type 4a pilus ATPase [Thermodesulfovibrionia bacterium]|nr:PilT/PilU family type 4a pilus ATPase [Thermodesulfovibrionia bacterium]MCK5512214.1 PilT/PilU family type 4a pilus ATPase [Thermodesulfovibrionia bacterium]
MFAEKGKSSKLLFGEVLLEYGVVTREQLKKALEWQIHVGGRVGSILKEMGYLDDDSLLNFLSKQFNISPVNLFELVVPPGILNLLPFEKVRSFHAFPVKEVDANITLAMINPHDMNAIQEVEFALSRRVEPSVAPFYQMEKAINYFEEEGYGNKDFDGVHLKEQVITIESETPSVYSLLNLVIEHRATELHLTVGIPPSIRIDSEIKRLPLPSVTSEQMIEFIQEVLTHEQKRIFAREKEIDFALSIPHTGRFRINIYKQRNSMSLTARFIRESIPTIEDIGLPPWINDYVLKTQGFIVITGPSGHGKTTTLSAIIDFINTHRRCNIVTIEDPVEYLHKHKRSNVNQREIGVDTESFATGLKHIFRQSPDVIVVSELQDLESISIVLTAAERGHLVICTMNSQNTITAIDRIINVFPEHQQHHIRQQLADALLFILAQRLVPKKKGGGRVLACEKIVNSARIRNLIREGKKIDIRSLMHVASSDIMSLDHCLANHYLKEEISFDDGIKFSDNPSYFQDLIKSEAQA